MVLSWYEFQYHSIFLIQIVTFTSGIDFRYGTVRGKLKFLHLGESQTKKLNSYQLVIRCFLEILKMNNVKFVQSYTSSESSPSRHQVSPDVAPRLVPPPLALPPSISTSSTNLDQKPNDFEVIKLENQVIHSIKIISTVWKFQEFMLVYILELISSMGLLEMSLSSRDRAINPSQSLFSQPVFSFYLWGIPWDYILRNGNLL